MPKAAAGPWCEREQDRMRDTRTAPGIRHLPEDGEKLRVWSAFWRWPALCYEQETADGLRLFLRLCGVSCTEVKIRVFCSSTLWHLPLGQGSKEQLQTFFTFHLFCLWQGARTQHCLFRFTMITKFGAQGLRSQNVSKTNPTCKICLISNTWLKRVGNSHAWVQLLNIIFLVEVGDGKERDLRTWVGWNWAQPRWGG